MSKGLCLGFSFSFGLGLCSRCGLVFWLGFKVWVWVLVHGFDLGLSSGFTAWILDSVSGFGIEVGIEVGFSFAFGFGFKVWV